MNVVSVFRRRFSGAESLMADSQHDDTATKAHARAHCVNCKLLSSIECRIHYFVNYIRHSFSICELRQYEAASSVPVRLAQTSSDDTIGSGNNVDVAQSVEIPPPQSTPSFGMPKELSSHASSSSAAAQGAKRSSASIADSAASSAKKSMASSAAKNSSSEPSATGTQQMELLYMPGGVKQQMEKSSDYTSQHAQESYANSRHNSILENASSSNILERASASSARQATSSGSIFDVSLSLLATVVPAPRLAFK